MQTNYICPKCHDHLTVEKKPFVDNQPLYKVGCHNCGAYGASVLGEEKAYAEFMRYMEKMEKDDRRKILTDIRDYLVTEKGRVANSDIYLLQIQAVENFVDKALAALTEYAEKLGVEL